MDIRSNTNKFKILLFRNPSCVETTYNNYNIKRNFSILNFILYINPTCSVIKGVNHTPECFLY